MRLPLNTFQWEVLFRCFMATIGGFLFSIFLSLLVSFILPIKTMHAVAWSTMLFFIILPAVVMWVFGIKNYQRGALHLTVSILCLVASCWLLAPSGVLT